MACRLHRESIALRILFDDKLREFQSETWFAPLAPADLDHRLRAPSHRRFALGLKTADRSHPGTRRRTLPPARLPRNREDNRPSVLVRRPWKGRTLGSAELVRALLRWSEKSRVCSHLRASAGVAKRDCHSRIGASTRPSSCQRRLASSPLFARPSNRIADISFVNSKLGQPRTHFLGAASLQRTKNDAIPIGAHIKVFHLAKARDYRLRKCNLVLDRPFS